MGISGRDILSKLIQSYKCIYPFDYALLDGDGYVLTVRRRNYTSLPRTPKRRILRGCFYSPQFRCTPHRKSKYGRMGLSFLNAAKVHSGFVGRLALELVNLSNNRQPITIKRGDPLMHIEYITRDGEPSPYIGDYMFQYMTEDEVSMYKAILKEQFKNLFDHTWLDKISNERVHG